MIGWGSILYGAALTTAVAALVLVFVKRERDRRTITVALVAAFLGPLAWNALLHRAGNDTDGFFVDIPFKPFPVSWQDTGSGVFTLATASLLLGLALGKETAGRVLGIAATVAMCAFIVDIYCY